MYKSCVSLMNAIMSSAHLSAAHDKTADHLALGENTNVTRLMPSIGMHDFPLPDKVAQLAEKRASTKHRTC